MKKFSTIMKNRDKEFSERLKRAFPTQTEHDRALCERISSQLPARKKHILYLFISIILTILFGILFLSIQWKNITASAKNYINIFESYSYIDSMLIQIILLATVISLIIWFIIDITNDYHHIKNYDIIEQAISGKQ